MSELPGIEAPIKPTARQQVTSRTGVLIRALASGAKAAAKQADIKRLQAYEQWLRKQSLRLLGVQALGAWAAYAGVNLYSHRVALIVLGAGVILAAEMQSAAGKAE